MIEKNSALAPYCTLGIGGKAAYLTKVSTIEQLKQAVFFAKKKGMPYLVIGKGSNCLFDDRGYSGLVIINRINFCEMVRKEVFVSSGFSFSRLGQITALKNLSGLEFSSCIPATVGGAVFMNAGANGKETKDHLIEVLYLTEKGSLEIHQKKDLEFSYRFSSFQKMKGVIVSARFVLNYSTLAKQNRFNIMQMRKKTQPLEEQSAGSFFRNPSKEISAGALIDQVGLKGFQIGGAKISEKHANFIINHRSASSKEVLALMEHVQRLVEKKTDVLLIPEVRYIPFHGI